MALAVDPSSGALTVHGEPVVPAAGRVIHLCADRAGEHLVLAHPVTQQVSVLALRPDGTLGEPRAQPEDMGVGFFAHQAKLDPEGVGLVTCAMGADASASAPDRPGELTAFRYTRGTLARTGRVRLGTGLGPRHLDYAHGRVYVAVERGNRLAVFDYAAGVLAPEPRFVVDTLAAPANVRPSQRAGAIRFHPNRRWLYVTNRANATVEAPGTARRVFAGGENAIALFVVDDATGEPRAAGFFDTDGIEPRAFTIDPGGSFLIVANHSTLDVRDPDGSIRSLPRSWVVFRIEADGRLTRLHRYERTAADLFWIGSGGARPA